MSVHDVQCRRIPRLWILCGFLAQLLAYAIWMIQGGSMAVIVEALLISLLSALVQLLLALLRPGALGFGDVTCTLLIGLAVGSQGIFRSALWWLIMGLLGCCCLVWAHMRGLDSIAYAPVIVSSGLIATVLNF
ncbi:peptidase A24 [Bifidobacterium aquikefiri]|uniref:Peptidase A24 n=2 Tax=Bifidobacterium aquikefiri TaxID=1653207 RepID=A0A261G6Y2_9BIFI|nr:peptidase A24 [Bifidobacterium aquikefiri]